MLRLVIDTNIWIRTLIGGQQTLPILTAFRERKFIVLFSEALIEELKLVSRRTRLKKHIDPVEANELGSLGFRGVLSF
jgi:uncharacterized protein